MHMHMQKVFAPFATCSTLRSAPMCSTAAASTSTCSVATNAMSAPLAAFTISCSSSLFRDCCHCRINGLSK